MTTHVRMIIVIITISFIIVIIIVVVATSGNVLERSLTKRGTVGHLAAWTSSVAV